MSDSQDAGPDSPANEQPFLTHLIELRDRLLRAVIVILLIFVVLFAFSTEIFELIARP